MASSCCGRRQGGEPPRAGHTGGYWLLPRGRAGPRRGACHSKCGPPPSPSAARGARSGTHREQHKLRRGRRRQPARRLEGRIHCRQGAGRAGCRGFAGPAVALAAARMHAPCTGRRRRAAGGGSRAAAAPASATSRHRLRTFILASCSCSGGAGRRERGLSGLAPFPPCMWHGGWAAPRRRAGGIAAIHCALGIRPVLWGAAGALVGDSCCSRAHLNAVGSVQAACRSPGSFNWLCKRREVARRSPGRG